MKFNSKNNLLQISVCSTCLQSGESNTICAFRSNQMFFTEGRSKLRALTSTPNLFYSFRPGKEEWFATLMFYFSNAEFYCLTCNLTLSFLLCFKVCVYIYMQLDSHKLLRTFFMKRLLSLSLENLGCFVLLINHRIME